MNYIKISDSRLFCGVVEEYTVDTVVVDDELFDYVLGLSGIVVYHGDMSDTLLTLNDKGIFTTIDIVNEQPTEIEILQKENEQLKNENIVLKQMDSNLVNLSWDMDYRVCEIEWTLEEIIPQPMTLSINENNNILKGSAYTMALSRFEQAKIIILSGDYDRTRMEYQITNYLKRGYLTQEEYDILISMMDANEIITQ